jgi:hypothetical protein
MRTNELAMDLGGSAPDLSRVYSMDMTVDLSLRIFDLWFGWSSVWLGCRILNLRLGRRYFWVWRRHLRKLRHGRYVLNLVALARPDLATHVWQWTRTRTGRASNTRPPVRTGTGPFVPSACQQELAVLGLLCKACPPSWNLRRTIPGTSKSLPLLLHPRASRATLRASNSVHVWL